MLLLASVALRGVAKGALLTSLFVVLFFSYGRGFEWVWGLEIVPTSRALHAALSGTCAAVFGVGALALVRTRRDLGEVSRGLTRFAAILVLWSAGTLAWEIASAPASKRVGPAASLASNRPPAILKETADKPDIYYIVMDGYARADVLQEVYHFDNVAFIAFLRSRGFFVAEHGRSNYPVTHLSLASTLSMRYLEKEEVLAKRSRSRIMYKLIGNNAAARFLQGIGYRYVHFNTNYGGTEKSKVADIHYSYRSPLLQTELMSVLLRTTMLRPLEPSVAHLDLYMMEKITEVPAIEGPTFTFLHLLLPHNPYVFDRDGNIRADVPLTLQFEERTGGWKGKKEYLGQLTYLNHRMEGIIDSILAKSITPPIIILQSDHGTASQYGKKMSAARKLKFYHERTANFNAWYAPEQVRSGLTDDMVPVNTFRTLFRQLFGADLPPLEKRIYTAWYRYNSKFAEITDLLDVPPVDPSGGVLAP